VPGALGGGPLLRPAEQDGIAAPRLTSLRVCANCPVFVLLDRITVDPQRMSGRSCIRDLRVTVAMVLEQLAAGRAHAELLADYPYLEADDISAALEFAAARVSERELPAPLSA